MASFGASGDALKQMRAMLHHDEVGVDGDDDEEALKGAYASLRAETEYEHKTQSEPDGKGSRRSEVKKHKKEKGGKEEKKKERKKGKEGGKKGATAEEGAGSGKKSEKRRTQDAGETVKACCPISPVSVD